jgi:hypothetical protein
VKLKRTVTIEIDCVKITSARCFGRLLWCEFCHQQAKFLTAAEILEIAEIAGINRTVDKSRLHFYQASETERLICLKSILDSEKSV